MTKYFFRNTLMNKNFNNNKFKCSIYNNSQISIYQITLNLIHYNNTKIIEKMIALKSMCTIMMVLSVTLMLIPNFLIKIMKFRNFNNNRNNYYKQKKKKKNKLKTKQFKLNMKKELQQKHNRNLFQSQKKLKSLNYKNLKILKKSRAQKE